MGIELGTSGGKEILSESNKPIIVVIQDYIPICEHIMYICQIYWELNSGPLEEQSVLLTTEPSLQPPPPFFFFF